VQQHIYPILFSPSCVRIFGQKVTHAVQGAVPPPQSGSQFYKIILFPLSLCRCESFWTPDIIPGNKSSTLEPIMRPIVQPEKECTHLAHNAHLAIGRAFVIKRIEIGSFLFHSCAAFGELLDSFTTFI